jgi:uncharacterized protein YbaA (DUF1428 family)
LAGLERLEHAPESEDTLKRLRAVSHCLAETPLELSPTDGQLLGDALHACLRILEKHRGSPHGRIWPPLGVDTTRDRPGDRSRSLSWMLNRREIADERGRTPGVDRVEQDVHIGELVGGDTEELGPDPRREADADDHHPGRHGSPQRACLRTDHDHIAGDGPDQINPPVREHAQVELRRVPEFASPETLHDAGERSRWSVLAIDKTATARRHVQPTLTGGGSAIRKRVAFVQDTTNARREDRAGASEAWEVENESGIPHNFPHRISFQVLEYDGGPPPPALTGLKDTVFVPPGVTVRLAIRTPRIRRSGLPGTCSTATCWTTRTGGHDGLTVAGRGERVAATLGSASTFAAAERLRGSFVAGPSTTRRLPMPYIEGFVAAVPTANRDAYIKHATEGATYFKNLGATRVVECWGDDVPKGELTDFYRATQAKDGETVIFSWIEYPDKATRDAANKKMSADSETMNMEMPFDASRMFFGGFEQVVSE